MNEKNIFSLNNILLIVAILAGLFLFCYRIGDHNLWIDEAFSLRMANKSFADLIASVAAQDPHPPLYYLILKYWGAIFGISIESGVYLSIFFGFLAGIAGCYLYKLMFNKHPWIAAVLIFCSPFYIMYTRMIRYYSLASFLTVVLLIIFLKFLNSNNKKWVYLLALIHVIMIYCDYPASTIFLGEFITLCLFYRKYRDKMLKLLVVFTITIIAFIPWAQKLFYHLTELSKLPSADPLSGDIKGILLRTLFTIYDFSFGECIYPWNYFIIVPLSIIFIISTIVFFYNLKKYPHNVKDNILITITAVFVSFLTGILMANFLVSKQSFVYMPARLMFCFIPFILVIANGISFMDKQKYIISIVIVILYSFVVGNFYNQTNYINPLYAINWGNAFNRVNELFEPGDIVISDESEVTDYYANIFLKNAIYFGDERTLRKYLLENPNKSYTQRIFLLLTERDSTNYAYFSTDFIMKLLSQSEILFTREYAKTNEKYYNIKKQFFKKSYKYKMKLYLLKINSDLLRNYFLK